MRAVYLFLFLFLVTVDQVLSLYSTVCLRPLHLFPPTTLYVEVATGRKLVRHERHNPYF